MEKEKLNFQEVYIFHQLRSEVNAIRKVSSYKLEKMTKDLTFSNEKARKELGWEPLDVLSHYQI